MEPLGWISGTFVITVLGLVAVLRVSRKDMTWSPLRLMQVVAASVLVWVALLSIVLYVDGGPID